MRIAPIVLCSLAICLAYTGSAESFALKEKIEPIIAAKAQFARDVKVKVAAAADHAYQFKKKAAVAIATPIVAIKDWKKALLAKKLAKIAGPILALKNLKRTIIEKKLNTLASIIPAAAGFGLGGLLHTPEGYSFTQWNGAPFDAQQAQSFVLVPEEYTNYRVEDSARTIQPKTNFFQTTLKSAQSTLESIGNHVPFLSTLSNGVHSFKQPQAPTYQFVPNLGFHQYHNVHYEPNVAVNIPTAPEVTKFEEKPQEVYGVPSPYPPPPPALPELPTLPPQIPHEEYGIPSSTTTTIAPPAEYGPPPTSYGVPAFRVPAPTFNTQQKSAFSYTQRF